MTTDSITIRRARSTDLSTTDALFAASYAVQLKPDYPPSVLVLALPLLSRAQPQLLASGRYFLAEDDTGRLVGAGGWSVGARRGDVGQVRHVVTDHRLTRRGIGQKLMSHIFETARASGVRHLQCQSTRTAVPFYAALGFRTLGPIEVPLRPGISFPAIAMDRPL